MIKTIRIQNFRSLQDVTLTLQDVNLLIGPNNSGKSNLLKAFEFLGDLFDNNVTKDEKFLKNYFYLKRIPKGNIKNAYPITFTFRFGNFNELKTELVHKMEIFGINYMRKEIVLRQFIGVPKEFLYHAKFYNELNFLDLNFIENLKSNFELFDLQYVSLDYFKNNLNLNLDFDNNVNDRSIWLSYNQDENNSKVRSHSSISYFLNDLIGQYSLNEYLNTLSALIIYSADISNLKKPYPTLESDYSVKSNASNLVAFLDNMRDNKPSVMEAINTSLNECIKEFKSISFEKVALPKDHDLRKIHGDKTFKRLGVQDIYGQIYWADELSDGTLYFLALLSIVHQPNPPKLLMIEEPENGIHPRRIKELMDYFFEIAEKQGVQVIMTTHSTVVIDQFVDLPESIFVFDKKGQATTVKNLKTDIIAEDTKQSEKLNVPKLDLSQSLGDHWASGLIGGVPR